MTTGRAFLLIFRITSQSLGTKKWSQSQLPPFVWDKTIFMESHLLSYWPDLHLILFQQEWKGKNCWRNPHSTEPQEGRSGKLQDFIIQVRTANHGLHLKLGVLKSIPKTNPQIPHWIDRLDRMIYEGPWSLHGTLMQVLSMKICWDAACHPGFLFSRKMPTSPHPIWLWLNIIDPRKKSESNSWACFGPGFPPLNHKSRSLVWSQWKSPSSDG